jgi:hypothetical protein
VKSYAERQIFHEAAMAIWADAVDIVKRVSPRHGNEVRCHELARAALTALEALNHEKLVMANASLQLYDGQLWAIEHSWLVYRWNDEVAPKRFILDVYTPGRLPQVQLLDGEHFAICRGYKPGPVRTDIDLSMFATLLREMQT